MTAIASLSVTAEISHSVGNTLCLIFLTVLIHLLSFVWLCDLMDCSLPGSSVLTISQSLLRFMSIESLMLSNYLILYWPLLLLPSSLPSFRVFSNQLALRIRWPKHWSFSFSDSPSNGKSGLVSFRLDWFDVLKSKEFLRVFPSTTFQKHTFFQLARGSRECGWWG